MRDDIAGRIVSFFEVIGIDFIYAGTLILVLLMFSYRSDIRNWNDIRFTAKGLIIVTAIATTFAIVLSILRLVGVVDF